MEEVVFDQKMYIKASAAAKRFKYAQDYIGQLCREDKIDARLVGRTWYVNPESLQSYKKRKFEKSAKEVKEADDNRGSTAASSTSRSTIPVSSSESAAGRRRVGPVLLGKTAKAASTNVQPKGTRSVTIEYSVDDGHLIPPINRVKTPPPQAIPVDLADAEAVKVSGDSVSTNYKPEALPEISLNGKLSVGEWELPENNEAEKPAVTPATVVPVQPKTKPQETSETPNKPQRPKRKIVVKTTRGGTATSKEAVSDVRSPKVSPQSAASSYAAEMQSVKAVKPSKSENTKQKTVEAPQPVAKGRHELVVRSATPREAVQKSSWWQTVGVLASVLIAIGFGYLSLSLVSEYSVSAATSDSGLWFDGSSLKNLWSELRS